MIDILKGKWLWLLGILASRFSFYLFAGYVVLAAYKIEASAAPLYVIMVIEGLIPFLLSRMSMKGLQKLDAKMLLVSVQIFCACGIFLPTYWVDSSIEAVYVQAAIIAAAAVIFNPLLMTLGVRASRSERERTEINRLITSMTGIGLLGGFLFSGMLIDYLSISQSTMIVSTSFLISAVLLYRCSFSKTGSSIDTQNQSVVSKKRAEQSNHKVIYLVIVLCAVNWITGGSINIVEIPFADKHLNLGAFGTSVLFAASALGTLSLSVGVLWFGVRSTLISLISAVLVSALSIICYISLPSISVSIVALFFFGCAASVQNHVAMGLLQESATNEDMDKYVVMHHTVGQVSQLAFGGLTLVSVSFFGILASGIAFPLAGIVAASFLCLYTYGGASTSIEKDLSTAKEVEVEAG